MTKILEYWTGVKWERINPCQILNILEKGNWYTRIIEIEEPKPANATNTSPSQN